MTQEEFFGFQSRPFQAPPQEGFFVAMEPHVEAVTQLMECAVKGDGIGILTAPPGSGKTMVCQQLLAELASDFVTAFLPSCSFPTRRALLQAILFELGREYAGLAEQELRLKLLETAQALTPDRAGIVLILDEAHQLSARLLEELRCLTNHVELGRPLIRILLSGQLALEEALARPELHALNYRITCHATLDPLTLRQSAAYLESRLALVGGQASNLFTADALETMCRVSDGNPRCLNQIADASLTRAAELQQPVIDAGLVRRVLQDLKQLPLQWNISDCDQTAEEPASLGDQDEDEQYGRRDPGDQAAGWEEMEIEERPGRSEWSSPQVATFEVGGDKGHSSAEDFCSKHPDAMKNSETINATCESAFTPTFSGRSMPERSPSVLSVSGSAQMVDICVEDRYALLDRGSQLLGRRSFPYVVDPIDWHSGKKSETIPFAHAVVQSESEPAPSASPDESCCESDVVATLRVVDAFSPEESIDRVIQVVSDAVAMEIARDRQTYSQSAVHGRISRTDRGSEWRATPEPGLFDIIEPDWEADQTASQSISTAALDETASDETETPAQGPQLKVEDAAPWDVPAATHGETMTPGDRHERPYARLFSRARRSRL